MTWWVSKIYGSRVTQLEVIEALVASFGEYIFMLVFYLVLKFQIHYPCEL